MSGPRWTALALSLGWWLGACGAERDEAADAASTSAVAETARRAERDSVAFAERARADSSARMRAEAMLEMRSPREVQGAISRPVRGTVEIQLDSARYVPAEYFLVSLEGGGGRYDAVTSRTGEFMFRSVPPGMYVLGLAVGKSFMVFRQDVDVPEGEGTFIIPHVHVSSDSLPSRAAK